MKITFSILILFIVGFTQAQSNPEIQKIQSNFELFLSEKKNEYFIKDSFFILSFTIDSLGKFSSINKGSKIDNLYKTLIVPRKELFEDQIFEPHIEKGDKNKAKKLISFINSEINSPNNTFHINSIMPKRYYFYLID